MRAERGTIAAIAPGALLKGIILSLASALILSLIVGIVFTIGSWHTMPRALMAVHYVCIGLGSVIAARQAGRVGWLHGGVIGILYSFLLLLLFHDGSVSMFTTAHFSDMAWSFIVGGVAGMVGINMKQS